MLQVRRRLVVPLFAVEQVMSAGFTRPALAVTVTYPAPVAPTFPLINPVKLSVTTMSWDVTGPAFTISRVYVRMSPAGTVARLALLTNRTSAEATAMLDETGTVVELFERFPSGRLGFGEVTDAELTIVPAVVAVVASVTGTVVLPDGSGPPEGNVREQVMVAGPTTGAAGRQVHAAAEE